MMLRVSTWQRSSASAVPVILARLAPGRAANSGFHFGLVTLTSVTGNIPEQWSELRFFRVQEPVVSGTFRFFSLVPLEQQNCKLDAQTMIRKGMNPNSKAPSSHALPGIPKH